MTQFLPPNLLALFAPREPMPYMPPLDKLPHEKTGPGYHGVGTFLDQFEDPKDTPPPTRVETKEERLERKRKEKEEEIAMKLDGDRSSWDPNSYVSSGDAFKTLFVARINYDTSESKLRREFESYGPIKSIRMVHDVNSGKPRGYAFIEYEHERDMHSAYKYADGKKIDGRRVLVDVERARTVKGWTPRRLGGGLGSTRKGGPDVNIRHSGREDMMLSSYRDRGGDDERGERPRERRREDRGRDMELSRERRRSRSRSRERRRDRGDRGERERDRGDRGDRERERGPGERVERDRGERDRGDRGDRDRDRERRRDRDKDRERKHRDRDRRDRDKGRDRDRDRDRGRDKDRDRNKEDKEHEDRDRDRERKRDRGERERDIENGEQEQDVEQHGDDVNVEPALKKEKLDEIEEVTSNHQPPSPPPEELVAQEIPDSEMEHQ